ncbi:lipid II flippase MurJ [Cellulomonas sp. NTE-D12]|uniref:murein biosynthesis integral membrane protein MurJ n=1 Tax=Cellulomonas sp. NTE-D12 TaxID=2962632 RepID=UPI003081A888|nr:hypothetical protein CELD12_19860 [Cellulomonas sp. NTE-D12]
MSPARRRLLGGLAGAAAMIAVVTALSRVLGFVRYLVGAGTVGMGGVADAYNSANVLPNVLFEVAAGGALAGALVPLLAGPVLRRDAAEVDRIVGAALGWTLLVLTPLGLLLAAVSGPVAHLVAGDRGAGAVEVLRFFVVVFAAQVPMYGLTVLLYAVLQAHRRFFWPAFAPVMSSLVVVATFLGYGLLAHGQRDDPAAVPGAALQVLAWGTTAGVASMCFPMLVPVRRLGVAIRPTLRFPPGVARRFRSLAFAGVGAVAAQQLSVLVVLQLAVTRGTSGSYTTFVYGQQVYLLPYAILVVPLATSTFPRVAARVAASDQDGFARLSALTTRAVLAAAATGAAALLAAAPAVARVFAALSHSPSVQPDMTALLTWMLPGVVGFAAMFHVSRTLYALERARSAVVSAAVGWGTVAVVAVVAVVALTSHGPDRAAVLTALGLATTAGMTAGGGATLVALRRAAGPAALDGLTRTLLVLGGAGAVAAVAGRWVADAVSNVAGTGAWTALGAAAGAGLVALLVVVGAVLGLDRETVHGMLRAEHEPARS